MARIFKEPEPLKDTDEMPSGKYKGYTMQDLPARYLIYIYENEMCSERVKHYIVSNLDTLQRQAKAEK